MRGAVFYGSAYHLPLGTQLACLVIYIPVKKSLGDKLSAKLRVLSLDARRKKKLRKKNHSACHADS